MTEMEAREALKRWRENYAQRDELVRDAYAAGVNKYQIHVDTGLARTTIDEILGGRKEHPALSGVSAEIDQDRRTA